MTTIKNHRVALVGCGALAQYMHLPNIKANPRLTLSVTCDVDQNAAETSRDKFCAERAETDWRKVVAAKDIDLIVLATQHNFRGELIIPALLAGKPVYTEKPLGSDIDEMRDIVKVERATKIPVCVGHNRRSSPAVLEFKRLFDKARSGIKSLPPTHDRLEGRVRIPEETRSMFLMRVNDDARSWKHWSLQDKEGMMFCEMVHFIDLALWLHPFPPVRAFANGSVRGNFVLVLHFEDGSIANIHHTLAGHFDYAKELLEVATNNITIALEQHIEVRQCGIADEPVRQTFPYDPSVTWAKEEGITGYFKELEIEQKLAGTEGRSARWLNVIKGHVNHLDRFITHIEGKGPNPCDVESAIPVTRIALKLLESARLGLPVPIAPEDWNFPNV